MNELMDKIADYEKVILTSNQQQSSEDPNNEFDPDEHFYYNGINKCGYYTEDQFNKDINMDGKLSIIHFNSRSLYANFDKIQDYHTDICKAFQHHRGV